MLSFRELFIESFTSCILEEVTQYRLAFKFFFFQVFSLETLPRLLFF